MQLENEVFIGRFTRCKPFSGEVLNDEKGELTTITVKV
jgi:hypothetical protein